MYGWQAGGTHPTGMLCCTMMSSAWSTKIWGGGAGIQDGECQLIVLSIFHYSCNSIVVFTTYWKFWCCCIHCLFGADECQWLVFTHTFLIIPTGHYFQIHISHFCWLDGQFMNTRLVTMSASLCTQTGLHCLIIQVLHIRVWFLNIWYTSPTSVHSNLEHRLAILTESFSPLISVLHNLSCWSPNQKSTSIDTQYNSLTSVTLHNII